MKILEVQPYKSCILIHQLETSVDYRMNKELLLGTDYSIDYPRIAWMRAERRVHEIHWYPFSVLIVLDGTRSERSDDFHILL